MDAIEGHLEEKKLVKRKRKLHHGPSSLLRATIQEYGVYDKQVDAFRTMFLQLFGFLETWQTNATNRVSKMVNGTNESYVDCEGAPGLAFCKPINRELCLEEELQVRLGRMTSIAKTLRNLCSKEREQKLVLYKEISNCKEACLQLLTDMIGHFHKETGILQHRLLEMDSTLEECEQEKNALKQAYDEMVGYAHTTIDNLEGDLIKTESALKDATEELQSLKTSYNSLQKENATIKEEIKELQEKMKVLKRRMKEIEIKASGSDMTREHYETLLEIALNKLRMFEDGELRTRVSKGKRSSLDLFSQIYYRQTSQNGCANTGEDANDVHVTSTPLSSMQRRYLSDNMSITSFDTTVSEISMPVMSLMDSSRYLSDDRLSNYSSISRGLITPSPMVPPRRKHSKHKQIFSKPLLRKSVSIESQLPTLGSTERLPTIQDELIEKKGSQDFSFSGSDNLSVNVSRVTITNDNESKKPPVPGKSSIIVNKENICDRKLKEKSVTIKEKSNVKVDASSIHYVKNKDGKRILSKKVQRTSSFAGLRSKKNGLVALAKDIEKRFKKKRRSKTTDFAELSRINQSTGDRSDDNDSDNLY